MRMKSIFRHETILFLVVIVALVILSIQAEQFATIDNLLNQGQTKANSASDYNFKLSQALAATVVTGKPQRIVLSKEAKKDLINSIDTDMLKKHLTVGPTPKIDANNAINPGKGKVNGLLKGNWGNQGGTHINYDPSSGGLTITSVKMLRDFGDLDEKDAGGKITNFHDIPNPTTEQIQKVLTDKKLEGPLKKMFKNNPRRFAENMNATRRGMPRSR